jgi:UDP-2,4-diacetamido-2,4,6-trideoxy-beta-L-altropyranose hydrolase
MARSSDAAGRLLLVRADASPATGTGHLMRALALAQAWRDRGGDITWFLAEAPEPLRRRIADEGIRLRELTLGEGAPGGRGTAGDAAVLRAALEADERAVAVVDGQAFDREYLAALGPAAGRVLVVDDAADRDAYDVGLVLNQNAHADRAAYPADAPARFLLGTRYVLLRREFGSAPPARTIPGRARHVLVAFGGADPSGMSRRALEALAGLPEDLRRDLEVRLVIGAANRDADRLEDVVRELAPGLRVGLERDVADMPGLFAWADLALTSGGSAVWELARMGVPAIVVETVPVETLLASGLAGLGLGDPLGRADALDDATICAAVARRIDDDAWRRTTAELGRRLVDGRGASRVVDALLEEVP